MIIGIGHDAVATKRFNHWHTYSTQTLNRVFSEHEIEYCLQNPLKSAERFAARFAAKEALYKALSQTGYYIPFLTLCAYSELIVSEEGAHMKITPPLPWTFLVSITHTDTYAYAVIIIQTSMVTQTERHPMYSK